MVLVVSHFRFGGRGLNSVVTVPGHCLLQAFNYLKVAHLTNLYFLILLKYTSYCRTCIGGYKKYQFLKYILGNWLSLAVCQGVFNYSYVAKIIYFCLRAKSDN